MGTALQGLQLVQVELDLERQVWGSISGLAPTTRMHSLLPCLWYFMAQVSIASFLASSDLIQAVEGHRAFPHLGCLTLGLLVHFRLLVDKMGVLDRFVLKVQGLGRFRIEDLESLGSLRRQILFLLFDQGGRFLGVLIHNLFQDLFSHAHPERQWDCIRHGHLVQG